MARARPFRLTPPEPREHDIQAASAAFLDVALLPGTVHFAVDHGAGQMTKTAALRLQERGGKKGVPDHFILHARRLFLIEFKSRTGRVKPGQREMHARLAEAGFTRRLGHRQADLLRRLVATGERGMLIFGNGNGDRQAMASLRRLGLADYIPGVDRGARATEAARR